MLKKPITIKDWQNGIASSPFEGFSDMRNVDISTNPGSVQLALRLQQLSPSATSSTFTVDPTTNIITFSTSFNWNGHISTNRAVVLTTTNTLPSPLTTGTTYYLIWVSDTSAKLSLTLDGAEIDITNTGTGVHTVTSINIGITKCYAYDSSSVFLLDSNGRVWKGGISSDFYLISGNSLTQTSGNGIALWKNYLFVFRNKEIDVYGNLSSTTPVWYTLSTASAGYVCNQGVGDSATHVTEVMSNDILYFSDRSSSNRTPFVGSISEISTFDPTNTATYNFTNAALDLPKYHYITDLQEYNNLMISTQSNKIYPWDTISDSFDDPITSPEIWINQMSVVNNLLYFVVAKTGNIYATQGTSNCQKIVDLPIYLTKTDVENINVAYMIPYNNGLLFTMQSGNPVSTLINAVWYYDLDLKALTIKNEYSNNVYSNTPGALFASGGTPYLAGWGSYGNTAFGLDGNSLNYMQRCTGYTGYVESALYQIGTSLYPNNLARIYFELSKPLIAGQGIKIEQRQRLSEAYTTIGTYDFTTYGAIQTIDDFPNVINAQTVQLRISLTALSSATDVLESPQLMNVTIQ